MPRNPRPGFTLIEILVVVIVLGILAALVVPQYVDATQEASAKTTGNELQKLRRAVSVFQARHNGALPAVSAGAGTWGEIVGEDYLMAAPRNPWVGADAALLIVMGDGPDEAFQSEYGWIYNEDTGDVWAGGFDAEDEPLPRE